MAHLTLIHTSNASRQLSANFRYQILGKPQLIASIISGDYPFLDLTRPSGDGPPPRSAMLIFEVMFFAFCSFLVLFHLRKSRR